MTVNYGRMSYRVLVTDDALELGDLVQLMLEKEDFDVLCCQVSTGTEALLVCRSEPPDLLILDIALPDCHGIDVLRQLKGDPATSSIPVIVLTAMRGDIVKEAAAAGAVATILKPFSRAELVHAVKEAILHR